MSPELRGEGGRGRLVTAMIATRLYPEQVDALWARNGFGAVSCESRSEILRTAVDLELVRGQLLPAHPDGEHRPRGTGLPGLVLDGSIRVFLATPQRQVTFQYASAGELFGIPWIGSGGPSALTAKGQALTPARILLFSPVTLADLSARDIAVANAVITVLRGALRASVSLLAGNVLWSLRQRIARQLLDLACLQGDSLVVHMTVQDLADATGTVREVVTRVLKDMRAQGLIGRTDGELTLEDVQGLRRLVEGPGYEGTCSPLGPVGTSVPGT
jgi:CRP-like cAMP-binding protein